MVALERERAEHFLDQAAAMFGTVGRPVREHLPPAMGALGVLDAYRKRGTAAHHPERIAYRLVERYAPHERFDLGQPERMRGHRLPAVCCSAMPGSGIRW